MRLIRLQNDDNNADPDNSCCNGNCGIKKEREKEWKRNFWFFLFVRLFARCADVYIYLKYCPLVTIFFFFFFTHTHLGLSLLFISLGFSSSLFFFKINISFRFFKFYPKDQLACTMSINLQSCTITSLVLFVASTSFFLLTCAILMTLSINI